MAEPDGAGDEQWPSEKHLLEQERARRLILHFDITQVLIMSDLQNGLTTDQVLNDILCDMAWGVLDTETGEWVLESETPSLDAPDDAMISYTQYIKEKYPASDVEDEKTRMENEELQTKAKHRFTAKGEPGQMFRGVYDQMIKNMTVPNGVKKGYGISKITVNETELPFDAEKDWGANLVRFGRYRILPSFFNLLISLNKEKRKNLTVVLRSSSSMLLDEVAEEINKFCNMQHPLYSGQNRTKKAILNGDKGSIDFQIQEANRGEFVTGEGSPPEDWYLSFEARNRVPEKPPNDDPDLIEETPPPEPTIYEGFQKIYAGLVEEITKECAMCCVETKQEKESYVAPKLFVDEAATEVQQIYFYAGTKPPSVEVLDAVDSSSVDSSEYLMRVDPYRAITEIDYFVRGISTCEAKMTRKILERKIAPVLKSSELTAEELKSLPPKEYLYRTVMPALLPGLQVVTRDRPADPVLWLALYLLRHPKQYSKALAAEGLFADSPGLKDPQEYKKF
jgi:hypothetical protein